MPDRSAITEAVEGLFGTSGSPAVDVVALACTHFPLLGRELAVAAPGPVTWLDSGEAIARRVASVVGAETGAPRARNVGFTDVERAQGLAPALRSRRFDRVHWIGSAPSFEATEQSA
jgi:glutamate racemase